MKCLSVIVPFVVIFSTLAQRDDERDHDERDREEREREEREREQRPTPYPTATPSSMPVTPEPTFVFPVNFEDTIESKMYPEDGTSYDAYGWSTAIHHRTAVVGAYGAQDQGRDSGAVYVYTTQAETFPYYDDGSTPWELKQKILLDTSREVCDPRGCRTENDEHAAENSQFGYAVAVWNETIVVGAHRADMHHDDGGGVYVYSRTSSGSWSVAQTLSPQDEEGPHEGRHGHENQYFGYSLTMSENYLVVGATGDDHEGSSTGAAYVFVWDPYNMVYFQDGDKLTPSNSDQFDNFGSSMGIHETNLIIGAPGDDDTALDCGAAYVFGRRGFWMQRQKLLASDGDQRHYFGSAVAVYGRYAVVGAYQGTGHWDNAGAAYVFYEDTEGFWNQQAKLYAHDGMTEDRFGYALDIYKDIVVVGAYGEQGKQNEEDKEQWKRENDRPHRFLEERLTMRNRALQGGRPEEGENCGPGSPPDCVDYQGSYSYRGSYTGAAYIFARSGTAWRQEYKIVANDTAANDCFGRSVAIHENVVFVGADLADGQYDNTGAAYVYAPPSMSPSMVFTGGETEYKLTGEVELDALLAVCLILIPAAIAAVWYYTNFKGGNAATVDPHANADHRMPVSQDSQHGTSAPWSMHGAFDESSSRGSSDVRGRGGRAEPPGRSPLRGPPVARGL